MAANGSESPRGEKEYLSSNEVVELLGISKSTLYAYVSRGLIHSEPVPDSPRTRRYRAADVERLLQRQRGRSDDEAVDQPDNAEEREAGATHPRGRQYSPYRGHDPADLAKSNSFESVMALLWTGDSAAELPPLDSDTVRRRAQLTRRAAEVIEPLDPPRRLLSLLPSLEQVEPSAWDERVDTQTRMGRDIMQLGLFCIAGAEGHSGFARTLQAYWAPGAAAVVGPIETALILAADVPNDPATTALEAAIEAGAPLHSAVTAGLATLLGPRSAGALHQIDTLIDEVGRPDMAYERMRKRLERGESLPGFVRRDATDETSAEMLLNRLQQAGCGADSVELSRKMIDAAHRLQGSAPTIPFAVSILSRAMGRQAGTGVAMIVLARLAGLIGIVIQRRTAGR